MDSSVALQTEKRALNTALRVVARSNSSVLAPLLHSFYSIPLFLDFLKEQLNPLSNK